MTPDTLSPFDAGADDGPGGGDSHLVLENAGGLRSLWPVWRAVPAGWTVRFGPAPHPACLRRVAAAG
ncbi:MbtH family NRPS accessory protein [Streptomyces sp. NPDC023723]|uniref:MbtH family NRPS accessory protein n=1 Tax=Streptomyces sp. NPDC023723 TaxID=3154323 RepID=UPI0033E40F04